MPKGGQEMEDKWVVAVGNSDKWAPGGDDDARVAKQIFRREGFPNSNIETFINRKAVKADIVAAIQNMVNIAKPEDTAVFFFSGHGGTNYLGFREGGMTASKLAEHLSGLKAQKQIILIQACYSGSIIDELEAENRLIVTSATDTSWSVDGRRLTWWGYRFLMALLKGEAETIREAYEQCNLGWIWPEEGLDFAL